MRLLFLGALSAFAWVGIALFTTACWFLIFLLYVVHPWLDPQRARIHEVASGWGRSLFRFAPGTQVLVTGRENFPGGPVILMANHQSYADIPALYFLRIPFKWMADIELFQIPAMGWSMGLAGYIPVARGNPSSGIRALEKAKTLLSHGMSVFIFPEGTRSHTGVFGRFQTGGFRLAVAAQRPIVPIVVVGTRQFLPRGSWIFQPGRDVKIHILPPVAPTGFGAKAIRPLAKKVRAQMISAYRKHLAQLR